MAATKVFSALVASQSCSANGTVTSSPLAVGGCYGVAVSVAITNGASAPSTACVATVNISYDGTLYFPYCQGTGSLTASAVQPYTWELPSEVQFVSVSFTGNTGYACTVVAQAGQITGL